MIQRCAIALTVLLGIGAPQAALALPLQAGTYSTDTRTILINVQDGRLCFQGISGNQLVTASIARDRRNDGFYRVEATEDRFYQQDLMTVLFGPLHELQRFTLNTTVPNTPDALMRQCLENDDEFYEEIETVG